MKVFADTEPDGDKYSVLPKYQQVRRTYHESTRLNKYVDCANLANDPILTSAGETAVNIC